MNAQAPCSKKSGTRTWWRPEAASTPAMLYVDLHLVHEVTSPQAFTELRAARPDACAARTRMLATLDHSTPTLAGRCGRQTRLRHRRRQKRRWPSWKPTAREFGIELHGWDSADRGIVHVIGPELGATQPGMTIVCGDSHTSTHGAFGALAFGIGTTEVGHVLATQCLLQRKPKTLAIHVDGALPPGVRRKDLILHIIGTIGVDGGTGHVLEYRGSAIEALSMEERMTVCNMSIEAGARAGLIAPDETTFAWLKGRPRAPQGADWDAAVARWKHAAQPTQAPATTTRCASTRREIRPTRHLRHASGHGRSPIDAPVPPATQCAGTARAGLHAASRPASRWRACRSMWCSSAAAPIRACRICAPPPTCCAADASTSGVRMLVVPGSEQVKRDAEREGLHEVFRAAGAEWREAGLLDVHRHERRHRPARPAGGLHQQPQFRRPPGQGRAHRAGQPAGGRGVGAGRAHRRSASNLPAEAAA